jgi:hypothetical protein
MRIQENYFNVKRATLRHWSKKVKAKEPEQLVPSNLLLNVKLQE